MICRGESEVNPMNFKIKKKKVVLHTNRGTVSSSSSCYKRKQPWKKLSALPDVPWLILLKENTVLSTSRAVAAISH